jgi:fumarate reductase subunit C
MSATSHNGTAAPAAPPTRTYPYRQSRLWWLRNRRYLLYMVREFTAIPIAIWMVFFLVEIAGLRGGSRGYQPLGGPVWVLFSLLCLVLALYHSVTFLRLAGQFMRIPMGDRNVPGGMIVAGAFSGFVLVSVVVGFLLIWGGL